MPLLEGSPADDSVRVELEEAHEQITSLEAQRAEHGMLLTKLGAALAGVYLSVNLLSHWFGQQNRIS